MKYWSFVVGLLTIIGGASLFPLPAQTQNEARRHGQRFTIDVALDSMTNAQIDVNPNDPNELNMGFARGDQGVVDGSIYPAHTLLPGTQSNDPENPHGRIGKIVCRAAYIVALSDVINGAPYASFVSELYTFDDEQHSTLIADGFGPTTGHTAHRAITGGTGRFRNMVGELFEENIGINESNFCNLRMSFNLRRVESDRGND